ncbi:hypothetical protein MKW92_030491 [Papaver armeniacum]|nr:hypothetical protein MKW92_030491 [Papaver armeniacum]
MRHVAETTQLDLEDLYIHFGWPLYRMYGHAYEVNRYSFTREVKEVGPDGQEVTKVVPALSEEVKDALIKNIRRHMTPQPIKIRADIEMKCFQFDGVLHIKEATRKAEATGNDDCPVKIKLVAPPLYVLTTHTLDKEQGIKVLTDAIQDCTQIIDSHKGKLVVGEHDDNLLAYHIGLLRLSNADAASDDDSEEEDTGMGDIDVDGPVGVHEM